MNDRVLGVFEDRATAAKAMSDLAAMGVEPQRMTVKRVLQPGHRGFSNSDTVHSLIHAPPIEDSDPVSEDAGTIILIVEMVERPEDDDRDTEPTGDEETGQTAFRGLDCYDNAAIMRALEQLGGTDTRVVEATPPLDL